MNWIKHRGSIDFTQARKAVEDIAISLMIDLPYKPSAEYLAIYPLYQLGLLEYGKTEKELRLFPCYSGVNTSQGQWIYSPESNIPRYQFVEKEGNNIQWAEGYFKSIPDFRSCILRWSEYHVENFKYSFSLRKHRFEPIMEKIQEGNIYMQSENVWTDKYIRIDNKDHLIPASHENPEAFRIAKSYAMTSKRIPFFKYSEQKLYCLYYQDIPIPIIRGLLLASPDNLKKEKLYHFNYQIEFDGIQPNIVRQLERIFSTKIL